MRIRRDLRDDRGATAVEYGLIAALIAVVILVAIVLLGSNLRGVFTGSANALGNAATPGLCATATASGTPLPTCDSLTGAWSCPTGYTITFANAEYTCTANLVLKDPYAGPVPASPASRNWGNSGGSLNLDSVPGVVYSILSCDGRAGACEKVTLSGRQVSAGSNWDNSNSTFDYVTLTVSWTVPETNDAQSGSGQITVSLT